MELIMSIHEGMGLYPSHLLREPVHSTVGLDEHLLTRAILPEPLIFATYIRVDIFPCCTKMLTTLASLCS